ncbi:hypothetical protein VTN77DRAFT_9724 [Rasamsonia byssochlamydoides]|uniref:uncharacterized protein n=1 Tax=Rasamsonia byssochlamydoides TaxID=89139 RepID=UPI003743CEAC
MRFIFALPLFLSAAFALNATQAEISVALTDLKNLEASGCNTLKCIASLAGNTASCAAAAAELGANPIADLACFGSVGASIANHVCAGCF